MKPVSERFWSKVGFTANPDKCWLWLAARDPRGYGRFGISKNERGRLAHRCAWQLTNGEIPDGMQICHHCDNPSCVNPSHLFLGTIRDNVQDMIKKGRKVSPSMPGEKNPNSKLTLEQVRFIHHRYAQGGISHEKLAEVIGVNESTIYNILNRRTWKDV